MKTIQYRLLTIILGIFCCLFSSSSYAYDAIVNGIYYNINTQELTAQVTDDGSRNCYSGEVVIPESFVYGGKTYIVTSIGEMAFANPAMEEVSSLTSVIIPNNVISIGDCAFEGCTALTSVTIPCSVTSIGHGSFQNCTNLTTFYIRNGLNSIGDRAFMGCSQLEWINLPSSVNNLGSEVFSGCTLSLVIENAIPISISANTFSGIDMSNSILYVPEGCLSTYQSANYWETFQNIMERKIIEFDDSDGDSYRLYSDNTIVFTHFKTWYLNSSTIHSAERVIIEEGVTFVGNNAFKASGPKYLSLPNSLTSIGELSFSGSPLTSVIIPNSVTEIRGGAFSYTDILSIHIPKSVLHIYDVEQYGYECGAFCGCDNLSTIVVDADNPIYDSRDNCNAIIETSTNTLIAGCKNSIIPNSVTLIGDYAFDGCTGLTSMTIPNSVTSIGSSAFLGCTGLTTVTIPNSIMSIGDHAFQQCTGLTSVSIPSSVTSIGYSAFSECLGLTSIIVEGETPASIEYNTYYAVDKTNCTLYVPLGSKSAYENANYWREFENIVEYDPEPDTDISTLDNAIYVEQTEGRIGGTKDISVKMKNDFDVRGFQFSMELPEGTTINDLTLNQDRMPAGITMNKVFCTENIDGNKINVVCALNDGLKTFTGNDGAIATVNVSFAEDMEEGTYPIYLTDASISDASAEHQLELSDIKATLILEDYVLGDTNGDGKVLVGDVIAILNYIVGFPSDNFNAKAADLNGDGKVLVGDVIAVLNIIVNL